MRSVAFKARYLNYFAVARVPTNIGIPVSLSAIIKTNGRSKKRFIGFSAGPAEVHFTPITVTAAAFVPSLSTSSELQKIVGQPSFFMSGCANSSNVSLTMIACVCARN